MALPRTAGVRADLDLGVGGHEQHRKDLRRPACRGQEERSAQRHCPVCESAISRQHSLPGPYGANKHSFPRRAPMQHLASHRNPEG